jgi:hypothetical protein
MCGMTGEAALLDGAVLELRLLDCVAELLVAAEAQVGPLRAQVRRIVGRMRVVALLAVAVDDDFVRAPGLRWNHAVMAARAHRVRVVGQQLSVRRHVCFVAAGAVSVPDWRVNEPALQLLLEIRVARDAQLPLVRLFQPVRVLLTLNGGGH